MYNFIQINGWYWMEFSRSLKLVMIITTSTWRVLIGVASTHPSIKRSVQVFMFITSIATSV